MFMYLLWGYRDRHALLRQTHLSSERGMGLPLRRLAGYGLLQHLVDLLERETL